MDKSSSNSLSYSAMMDAIAPYVKFYYRSFGKGSQAKKAKITRYYNIIFGTARGRAIRVLPRYRSNNKENLAAVRKFIDNTSDWRYNRGLPDLDGIPYDPPPNGEVITVRKGVVRLSSPTTTILYTELPDDDTKWWDIIKKAPKADYYTPAGSNYFGSNGEVEKKGLLNLLLSYKSKYPNFGDWGRGFYSVRFKGKEKEIGRRVTTFRGKSKAEQLRLLDEYFGTDTSKEQEEAAIEAMLDSSMI